MTNDDKKTPPTPDDPAEKHDETVLADADATVTHPPPTGGTAKTAGLPLPETVHMNTGPQEINQPPDRFTLTEVLGEGTQGEVCRAFDNHLQRNVAIKFPHRGNDASVAKEILEEARKAARLNHPNVVTIYDCGFWKGRPFIAMEYVDGASLADVLKECGRISVDRYLRYAEQILKALEAAHASNLFHRDLKPHNVLMASDGTLKLTDFGIAHLRSASGTEKTMRVEVAGTPAYMAPEQWLGKRPDGRSDIYAFGCMSHKLLSGRAPFSSEDTAEQHLGAPPPPIREIAPHVPPALEKLLLRCLAKKPDDRFQTATEVREALTAAASAREAPADATEWAKTAPRRKSRLGLVAAVVVVSAGLAGFFAFHETGRDLWARGTAFLGAEKTDDPPRDETAGDNGNETPTTAPSGEDPQAERIEQGRALLERARAAASPDEQERLAASARELLGSDPTLFDEASQLLRAARQEKERLTERMATKEFATRLEAVQESAAAGRHGDAYDGILELERMIMNRDALRARAQEVKTAKLPILTKLAEQQAVAGDFEAARRSFDSAAKVADSLTKRRQRDLFRRSAEVTATLHRCQLVLGDQPRYVLVTLARLSQPEPPYPSARLIRAKAELELGLTSAARSSLNAYLSGNSEGPLAVEARTLLQSLD